MNNENVNKKKVKRKFKNFNFTCSQFDTLESFLDNQKRLCEKIDVKVREGKKT